jgi:ribosomal protein S18 acetylase RimI-like enzyme
MITVREATVDDIPFMKARIWEAILSSPALVEHEGLAMLRQKDNAYWDKWTSQPEPAFIAQDDTGRKLGALTLKLHEKTEEEGVTKIIGWRIGIGVSAEVRGQGVGAHLIRRALDYSHQNGAHYLSLTVDPTNAPALALYHKMGFVTVAIGQHMGLDEMRVVFEKANDTATASDTHRHS